MFGRMAMRVGRTGGGASCVLAVVGCLLMSPASAFNSADWLEKREMLTREAERLRAAYSNCVAQVQTPAEDIVIPVETFPDGSVKTVVQAKKAQFFAKEGLVWAANVVIRKYDGEGGVSAQIDATNCVIDRYTKSGWANGAARVRHGKTEFCGEGVYFSSPEAYVMVLRRSDIVSKDLKFGGVTP